MPVPWSLVFWSWELCKMYMTRQNLQLFDFYKIYSMWHITSWKAATVVESEGVFVFLQNTHELLERFHWNMQKVIIGV